MVTKSQLFEMNSIKMAEVDKKRLVDISDIQINATMPIEEKWTAFIKAVKNPYIFLCGGRVVKIGYSENGRSLDESLRTHFMNQIN